MGEVHEEDDCESPNHRGDLLDPSGDGHSENVEEDTERDTIGDRSAESHEEDGNECHSCDDRIIPLDFLDALDHQDTDEYERTDSTS